ncbi:MAG: Na+/H+ antiporter subunit E [bacterium]|nr:Na+/H+ antiporter subunit E [bacterium]
MFLILFFLWMIFNGKVTLEIVMFGVVISAAIEYFMYRFMDYSPNITIRFCKNMLRILYYGAVLVKEVVKANLQVISFIFSTKYEVEPQIIHFKSSLKSDAAKVTLANSITLTPGTITVSQEGDTYTVLCLDKEFAEGIEDSEFVHLLEEMEE